MFLMFKTKENHIAYFKTIDKRPVAESPMLTNQISVSDNQPPNHMPPGISALTSISSPLYSSLCNASPS